MTKVTINYKDITNVRREMVVEDSITELDLSTKGIVILENKAFLELTNLEILWLHGNNISFLEENTFAGLKKLQKLYLYYNKIKNLPKGIFSQLISLKRLELSMNQISMLNKDVFRENKKLEKLSLDFNQLHELPETLFDNNTNLESLVLSSNNIISIPDNIFRNLNHLRFLSLSFNSISSLSSNLFSKESRIEEIRLDNNPFNELDLTSFQYTKFLRKIDILYNTGLEKIILEPVQSEEELQNIPDARIDFSASPVTQPPPVIVTRGLRAIVDYYSPEKTIFSSLTEIRLAFGVAGPEVKVDKCVLCKKPIHEKDRNICIDCETFYDDPFALGA